MIDKNDKLYILEDFHEDEMLPKFSKRRERNYRQLPGEDEEEMATFHMSTNITTVNRAEMVPWARNRSKNLGFFSFVWSCWLWIVEHVRCRGEIEKFFDDAKRAQQALEKSPTREQGYINAMEIARSSGQKALFDQLRQGLKAYRSEVKLLELWDTPTWVHERTIVQFYKKSRRGLRFDWVRNFSRQIPLEVLERKREADEAHIFDNYAVLHYDPKGKAYAESDAEKRRRKDPILFGLMKGQRRLYFVGDWKDEFCDLTLEQIADTLGKNVTMNVKPGVDS